MMACSSITSILMVLTVTAVRYTYADMMDTYASNEEFSTGGFESIPLHDQNSDATTVDEESLPSVDENPGNYFMTRRVSGKDKYNFSYRRGNKHHLIEYHQVTDPRKGLLKIQARWGDKNGGYGEQYWDYNHGGNDQSGGHNEDANGESSLNIRSPSHNPSLSVSSMEAITNMPVFSTTTPKRKYPKKNKKRYEDPKRKPKIQQTDSLGDGYVTLPRVASTTDQSPSAKNVDGPYHIDLYEQAKVIPTSYDHFMQISPSTSRSSRTAVTKS